MRSWFASGASIASRDGFELRDHSPHVGRAVAHPRLEKQNIDSLDAERSEEAADLKADLERQSWKVWFHQVAAVFKPVGLAAYQSSRVCLRSEVPIPRVLVSIFIPGDTIVAVDMDSLALHSIFNRALVCHCTF